MGFIEDSVYQQALAEQLWGVPVLPDSAPGVPIDPGNASEDPNDAFEVPSEQLTALPAEPATVNGVETAVPSETPTEAPPKASEDMPAEDR